MRTLSTSASAAALGVDRKTLDNVLSREARLLVGKGSRGRRRRISIALLEQVAIAMILNRDLGVSIAKGLELADEIVASPTLPVHAGSLCAVTFDLNRLRRALDQSIAEALESTAEPVRGRPKA